MLARIPDVGASGRGSEVEAGSASGDGRILSSGLSAKILMGGGLLLLLVAVMPFVFGSKDDSESWSRDEGSPSKAASPALSVPLAPNWEGQTAQTLKQAAVEAARARPDQVATENARREAAALSGQPQIAVQAGRIQTPPIDQGPRSIRPPERYARQPVPGEAFPLPGRYPSTQSPLPYDASGREAPPETNRAMALRDRVVPPIRYDANGVRRDYQAANHPGAVGNDPNADPRYDQGRYQREDPNSYRPSPGSRYAQDYADGYSRQYAGDARAYERTGYQPARAAAEQAYPDTGYPSEVFRSQRPGLGQADYGDRPPVDRRRDYDRAEPSARVADRRQAVGPRYPATSSSPAEQPGVARFKGTIEKPTVRTFHDGAGSSIY